MAKQQFTAPVIAPDLLARQLQMQRGGRMAEQVMNQDPLQGQMVSGHYVAPHATQGIARALQQYAAYQTMQGMDKEQSDINSEQMGRYASMFRRDDAQPSAQASPQALAQGLSQQGGQQSPQGGAQAFPVGAQPQQMAPQQPQQQQEKMPFLPGRSPQESYQMFMYLGPQEYMKLVAQQGAPTTEQRNLAHLPESQRNQLLESQYLQNAAKDGMQMRQNPDGSMSAAPVQGYGQIRAQNAGMETGAQEAAKAQYDLVDVPDGQGGTIQMPRAQAIQSMGSGGGGALGRTPPERVMTARQELSKVSGQAEQMISSIDGILAHPGLGAATGASSYLPSIRGTDRADFDARSAQLKGQAFLQAFESLKGGGQITEVEGKAATEAIARLDNAQSEAAYKSSLTELRGILEKARSRAFEQAGVPMPQNGSGPVSTPAAAPKVDRNALIEEARRRGLIK